MIGIPPTIPLPSPGRARWQPLRLGLVELYHYDVEEFWFRDGHLLLRGNNGTGRSSAGAVPPANTATALGPNGIRVCTAELDRNRPLMAPFRPTALGQDVPTTMAGFGYAAPVLGR